MQFLAPLFLLGAAAIAVPIVLHLVHREKTTRTPFASLMFIRKIPIKELRKRKLSHLFLLFLRCLGILLLVVAFGRPVATSLWLSAANPLAARSVVILLDHSLSMTPPGVWDRALQAAAEKVDSLDPGDEGLIIQFGETAEAVTPWEESPESLREALRRRVAPSFEATSYLEAMRMATDQLQEARNSRREIYLVTDLQRAGLSATAGWRVPGTILVEVRDVGAELPNLFVEDVRLQRGVFTDRYPNAILVRLRSTGEQPVTGEVQLFLEGNLIDRSSFEISGTKPANVTFKPFALPEGISRGRIVANPPDGLPTDNTFYFVVERQKPRQVLIVEDPGNTSGLYLESALSSGENLPFAVRSTPPAGLGRLNSLETPLVILNDLGTPPGATLVREYLNQGGGVIVVLSNRAQADAYNRSWGELLPVELLKRNFVRREGKPFTSITDVDWEHPIFWVFQDTHRAAISATQFYSHWLLDPKPESTVLARFSEGGPALTEGRVGQGRILVFSSSLDPVWTDFPLRSAYLPFWYRAATYAARLGEAPAALRINQVLPAGTVNDAESSGSGSWNVIDPQGQRVVGLDEETPDFIPLKVPGHYEVRSNKRTDWVAVNTPPLESDLGRLTLEEFQTVFVPRDARMEEAAVEATVRERDRQQSLWWFFLMAGAGVLILEWLVAGRNLPAGAPRAPARLSG